MKGRSPDRWLRVDGHVGPGVPWAWVLLRHQPGTQAKFHFRCMQRNLSCSNSLKTPLIILGTPALMGSLEPAAVTNVTNVGSEENNAPVDINAGFQILDPRDVAFTLTHSDAPFGMGTSPESL